MPRPAVEAALAKVVASETFRQSERHRAFLRYVVEGALAGRTRCLKEVVIGLDVFERDIDGYDPRRDSIVRVEARRLRKKLERYYAVEGDGDPVEIRLEAGSYVPAFVARSADRRRQAAGPLFVVLPFVTHDAGDALHAIAVGLADQLIHRLGSTGDRRVLAPLGAVTMRDADGVDASRSQHGVDYVVDGTLARFGTRLRCTALLSRARDRVRLWSGVFEFDASSPADGVDLFAFQDRIADALFDAAVACGSDRTVGCGATDSRR